MSGRFRKKTWVRFCTGLPADTSSPSGLATISRLRHAVGPRASNLGPRERAHDSRWSGCGDGRQRCGRVITLVYGRLAAGSSIFQVAYKFGSREAMGSAALTVRSLVYELCTLLCSTETLYQEGLRRRSTQRSFRMAASSSTTSAGSRSGCKLRLVALPPYSPPARYTVRYR